MKTILWYTIWVWQSYLWGGGEEKETKERPLIVIAIIIIIIIALKNQKEPIFLTSYIPL